MYGEVSRGRQNGYASPSSHRRGSVEIHKTVGENKLYTTAQAFYAQLCTNKRQARPDSRLMEQLRHCRIRTCIDIYSKAELGNLGALIEHAKDVTSVSLTLSEPGDVTASKNADFMRDTSSRHRRLSTPEVKNRKVNQSLYRSLRRALVKPLSQLRIIELPAVPIFTAGAKELGRGIAASKCLAALNLAGTPLGDAGLMILAPALQRSVSLQDLCLSDCHLTDRSAASLTSIITAHALRRDDALWSTGLRKVSPEDPFHYRTIGL